jgi:hypothetical protein
MHTTGEVGVGVQDQTWLGRAACRGTDPDMWFDQFKVDDCRDICNRCQVQAECLESALQDEWRYHHNSARLGVRAGLTGEQRKRLSPKNKDRSGVRG